MTRLRAFFRATFDRRLVVGYVILMAGVAFGFKVQADQDERLAEATSELERQAALIERNALIEKYERCIAGNVNRRAIRGAVFAVAQAIGTAATSDDVDETAAERQENAEIVARFYADLAQRLAVLTDSDCGPAPPGASKPDSTPPPAPDPTSPPSP